MSIKIFSLEGVELRFTDEALKEISIQSLRRGSGARGLRAILESLLMDVMFELPDQKGIEECLVDLDVAKRICEPKLRYSNEIKESA